MTVDSVTPYVCDEASEHTVESIAMFLPFAGSCPAGTCNDFLEIGYDRGATSNQSGSQTCSCTGRYWYFTFTDIYSNGTSNLYVPWSVAGTSHTNSIQELPIGGQLVAHYHTDSTDWPNVNLPTGDNPSLTIETNGEVLNDPADAMGGGTFSSLQYHAGTWQAFTNYTVPGAQSPYCNNNTSSGGTFSSYNWGPHGPTGCTP
jgi:hypothetical protein